MRKKKTRRLRAKSRPLVLKKGFWAFVLFLSLLCFFVYAVLLSSFFEVRDIRVQGLVTLTPEEVREQVVFRDIPFIQSGNLFFFDKQKTAQGIEEVFPQVRDVEVRVSFPHVIELRVAERQEVLVWCQTQCFAVDADGVAFQGREEPGARTVYGKEAELKERVLSPETVSSILEIQNSLEQLPGMQEAGLTIPSFRVVSQETLYARSSEGWEAYFSLQEDLAWQTAKFGAVFERELSQERRGSLEYVDVRFGDQAYVK